MFRAAISSGIARVHFRRAPCTTRLPSRRFVRLASRVFAYASKFCRFLGTANFWKPLRVLRPDLCGAFLWRRKHRWERLSCRQCSIFSVFCFIYILFFSHYCCYVFPVILAFRDCTIFTIFFSRARERRSCRFLFFFFFFLNPLFLSRHVLSQRVR